MSEEIAISDKYTYHCDSISRQLDVEAVHD